MLKQILANPEKLFAASISLFTVYTSIAILNKNKLKKRLRKLKHGNLENKTRELSAKKIYKKLNKIKSSVINNGSILGVDKNTGEQAVLYDKDANLHTLAVGTTGSGKTTTIFNIVHSAVARDLPLFYVDGKGDLELANKVRVICAKHNRKFYLFSMVGDSCKYNPLATGGYTAKKDRIIELREWSEDHYRKISEGYLQTVFKVLEQCNINVDIKTLAQYISGPNLSLLARNSNNDELIKTTAKLSEQEKNIQSLIFEIENLANSEIGHLFDCKSGEVLNLNQAFDENAVVYFCLQPLQFPAYAELLGKLVINDLKSLISQQLSIANKNKKKIYTIFDEFSVFAGDQIVNLINQGRGAGVHAVLATQSLSDISKKGGEDLLGQILNNCNNYIIQRQNNPNDAETLANVIGTRENLEVTAQLNNKMENVGSVKSVREFAVHPDEIKSLKLGEAFLAKKSSNYFQKISALCL